MRMRDHAGRGDSPAGVFAPPFSAHAPPFCAHVPPRGGSYWLRCAVGGAAAVLPGCFPSAPAVPQRQQLRFPRLLGASAAGFASGTASQRLSALLTDGPALSCVCFNRLLNRNKHLQVSEASGSELPSLLLPPSV